MLAVSTLRPRSFASASILRHAGGSRTWVQAMSTAGPPPENESSDKSDASEKPFLDAVVHRMNTAIRRHPGETLGVLFASDMVGVGAMYGLITLSGVEFSPEFALAFAASRPFRRFRLPMDIAFAAGVAKVFPAFQQVRLSELTGAIPSFSQPPNPPKSSETSLFGRGLNLVRDVIDRYGAAYMMGSRLAGVTVVSGLYFLITQGVDLNPILAKIGVEEIGSALGTWAAAVVFSSSFYPVTLGITGYVVPVVAKTRRALWP